MKELEALLRQNGAPLPGAHPIETEVRSEGIVKFETALSPGWLDGVKPTALIIEWYCRIGFGEVAELHKLLKTVSRSGKPMQQVLNEALQSLGIGSYLGTFVETGALTSGDMKMRVMFAYRSDKHPDIQSSNRAINLLLTAPGPNQEAADALSTLRNIWQRGSERAESALTMLSEIKLFSPEEFPYHNARMQRETPPRAD